MVDPSIPFLLCDRRHATRIVERMRNEIVECHLRVELLELVFDALLRVTLCGIVRACPVQSCLAACLQPVLLVVSWRQILVLLFHKV